MASWTAALTAVVALVGAVLGVLRYFNYRTKRDRIAAAAAAKRDRMAAVGSAFETVVEALASESEIKQLAAAIRLRRFFDPDSEVGDVAAKYAQDALGVMAGILREQPTGSLQKLLADGLAHAPSLAGADLQRTNLQGAYLGSTDVSRADFYQADLSGASLKQAIAREAVFYQARLVDTVFTKADLRGANFYEADLTRARFGGALLAGATFAGGCIIPPEVASYLDGNGRFTGPNEPLPPGEPASTAQAKVFVSRPSVLTPSQQALWRLLENTLSAAGVRVLIVERHDYPPAGILSDLCRVIADCRGVVVLGFRQLEVSSGRWRAGTPEEASVDGVVLATPWNQVEAGIAAALRLPVFVVCEPGVTGGVFDLKDDAVTVVADLDDVLGGGHARVYLQRWLTELR